MTSEDFSLVGLHFIVTKVFPYCHEKESLIKTLTSYRREIVQSPVEICLKKRSKTQFSRPILSNELITLESLQKRLLPKC